MTLAVRDSSPRSDRRNHRSLLRRNRGDMRAAQARYKSGRFRTVQVYLHAYVRRLTKRDKGLPYRTLSTQYRNIVERFRPSCSSLTFVRLLQPHAPFQLAIFVSTPTRQPAVIFISPTPCPYILVLVLPIGQAHAYYL